MTDVESDDEEPEPLTVKIRLELDPAEKVWVEQRRQEAELLDDGDEA